MRGHGRPWLLALALLALLAARASALNCARPPTGVVINSAGWPMACTNAAPGGRCYASCRTSPTFYAAKPQPYAVCQSDGTWSFDAWLLEPGRIVDAFGRPVCQPGCQDKPSDDLLKWGSFPFSCAGTSNGKACVGLCDAAHYGAPRMTCLAGKWTNWLGSCNNTAPTCGYAPALPVTNARWPAPAACSDVPLGGQCQAVCNPGYGAASQPAVTCTGTNTWGPLWPPSGGCTRVCVGGPPDSLLVGLGSAWPASCANKTAIGGWCSAECGASTPFGTPQIRCTAAGWDPSTMLGQCSDTPVCAAQPPQVVAHGTLATACTGAPVGAFCEADCDSGYYPSGSGAAAGPYIECLDAGDGTGQWSTTATGECLKWLGVTGLPFSDQVGAAYGDFFRSPSSVPGVDRAADFAKMQQAGVKMVRLYADITDASRSALAALNGLISAGTWTPDIVLTVPNDKVGQDTAGFITALQQPAVAAAVPHIKAVVIGNEPNRCPGAGTGACGSLGPDTAGALATIKTAITAMRSALANATAQLGGIVVTTALSQEMSTGCVPEWGCSSPQLQPGVKEVCQAIQNQTNAFLFVTLYPFNGACQTPQWDAGLRTDQYKDDPGWCLNYATYTTGNAGTTGQSYYWRIQADYDAAVISLERNGIANLPVVVGETGWASADNSLAHALPKYACTYNNNLIYQARSGALRSPHTGQAITFFLFEFFDEPKSGGGTDGNVENHWGVYRSAVDAVETPKYTLDFAKGQNVKDPSQCPLV